MAKSCFNVFSVLVLAAFCMGTTAHAYLAPGRSIEEDAPTFSIRARAGQIMGLEASVQETKRAYTDTPGVFEDYGRFLENYDLEELGFTDSYGAFGISLEKKWKYVTFQFDGSYVNPTADGVARRVYAIGVDEVEFNGQEYEYMLIPEGQSYDGDIQGGVLQANALITPFHIDADPIQFSPWLHLGIFSVLGHYEIDAGPPQGVTTYEYHDHEYVIGGKGTGWAGMAIPEIGIGGEIAFVLHAREHGNTRLVFDGNYTLLEFDGSTEDVGVSARNNKELDLSYSGYRFGARLEIPISKKTDFLVGLSYRHLQADATIEAQDRAEEEQEILREKYDKEVDFAMDTWFAEVGLRF